MKQIFFALLLITSTKSFAVDCNAEVQTSMSELNNLIEANIETMIIESNKPSPDLVKLKAVKLQISRQMVKVCAGYQSSYTIADSCSVKNFVGNELILDGKSIYTACENNAKELQELERQP